MTDLAALKAHFAPDRVSWRVGSTTKDKSRGMALGYIDARDVMDRLDEVCGQANWQDRYEFHGTRTVCYLSIKVGDEWVTKADGAGDSDVEAEKGAISDALKRAAVKWGVGRYLYDLASPWVELEQKGNTHVFAPSAHNTLRALLVNAAKGTLPLKAALDASLAITPPPEDQGGPIPPFVAIAAKLSREIANTTSNKEMDNLVRLKRFQEDLATLPLREQNRLKDEAAAQRKTFLVTAG